MCETAIGKLFECLDENLKEPVGWWPEDEFEERAMARWAVYEMINKIIERPFEDPKDVVYDFLLEMMGRASTANSEQKERTYTIACDTAEDVLTIL